MARRLVDSLAVPFEIARYHDTYREAVLDLIDRKASGEESWWSRSPRWSPLQSPDLMSALEASLERARERGAGEAGANGKDGAGKKAPTKKTSAKKAPAAPAAKTKTSG